MNELKAIEEWAGALLAQLSPAGRRAAMRDIARDLRRSQQTRIARQKNPDNSAFEPRKTKAVGNKSRDKRDRVKRTAMFMKLRTARWMKLEATDRELVIGFVGRAARVARVHQFGEKVPVAPHGPEYRYPARGLLGLSTLDLELVRDRLLAHLSCR